MGKGRTQEDEGFRPKKAERGEKRDNAIHREKHTELRVPGRKKKWGTGLQQPLSEPHAMVTLKGTKGTQACCRNKKDG